MRSGSKWLTIGPRPWAYACAYVDPAFTRQSYDMGISTSTRRTIELVRFSCAYAYALIYVDAVFTWLYMCFCLCLCLCASENQA